MANKVLVVVDMQNDFIDGSLSNKAAQAIVPKIAKYVGKFEGLIVFTRDTHHDDYLKTREGKYLPVPHCIHQTTGWQINDKIYKAASDNKKARVVIVDKTHFSAGNSIVVGIRNIHPEVNEIELCGTCTDICVVSNALNLSTCFRDAKISVHKNLCAGLTPEKHEAALEVMRSCQIEVV